MKRDKRSVERAFSKTVIAKILPPVSRFSLHGGNAEKKQRVLQKINALFERFFGLRGAVLEEDRPASR